MDRQKSGSSDSRSDWLKQDMSLQQAINAYVKKSDTWQAEFKGNKAYSLAMYTRIPYQRNQFVLMRNWG